MELVQSLIGELESSLSHGSSEQRSVILRRVTDLFMTKAESYSDEQVGVFDDVMSHLVEKIERQALIELSGRLAPATKGPVNVVHRLAGHDDIEVSGPVLEKSTILSDSFLVQLAQTKGQAHLAAIAGRTHIGEALSDVLVERGNMDVTRKVTGNAGARFSQNGLATIATRAATDEHLATALSKRNDVPPEIFDELLRKATEAVKQKLTATAAPAMQERINQSLDTASRRVARAESPARPQRLVNGYSASAPQTSDRLRAQLVKYAQDGQSAETMATLGMVCGVPTDCVRNVVRQGSEEGVIILGKAAGLGWPDLQQVLAATMPGKIGNRENAKILFEKFMSLSPDNAQRALQFIKLSKSVSRDAITKMM